jgi:hypothetical protein
LAQILSQELDRFSPARSTRAQLTALKEKHLDPVKYAFWVASKLKAAKTDGKSITMDEVLNAFRHKKIATKKRKTKAQPIKYEIQQAEEPNGLSAITSPDGSVP